MRYLLNGLEDELKRGTLVFPSQVAAEFWRRYSISGAGRSAVREDALISWDTFKETAFELRSDRVPANRIVRTAFAEKLIHQNARESFLEELIPPAFASQADGFTKHVLSVLPGIPVATAILRNKSTRRLIGLRRDLERIEQIYTDFLEDHGMFEPRWLGVTHRFKGGSYVLVEPELADDFGEFHSAVAGLPRLTVHPDNDSQLTVYPDSVVELRITLGKLRGLLVSGVDPEDIYLTVADFDRIADRLIHEAAKYDVPLSPGSGRSLADSSVGRLLAALAELVSSGFSVTAMETVLLNRGIPWQMPRANAQVVAAGIEHGCLGGRAQPDLRWRIAERSLGPDARTVFGSIMRLAPAVVGAKSLTRLRSSFNEFLSVLVVRDGWQEADERVLERCQEELRALARVESDAGLSVEDPFRFWCDRLAEQSYVPQREGVGIQVLPYKVGALVCPAHHFVIGANQVATSVTVSTLPFLSDADRSELEGEMEDRDLSDLFFDAYSASGSNVVFSASYRTHEGPTLPSGYFLSRGNRKLASEEELQQHHEEDSFAREVQDDPEFIPGTIQIAGAEASARAARLRTPDYTAVPVSNPDTLGVIAGRLRGSASRGLLRLSASSIDAYRACPFNYLLSRALGLDEMVLTLEPDNAAELGRLYHDILADFFGELASEGITFEAGRLPDLRARLMAVSERLHGQRRGMIPDVVYAARRPVFERIADSILENDALLIDGHEPLLVEDEQREWESEDGFMLVGRIDRATRAPDRSVSLVDYKKSRVPTKKAVNAGSPETVPDAEFDSATREAQASELGAIQIPLYVRLMEAGGARVTQAGYYSLEKARYLPVFSPPGGAGEKPCMSRERMDQVILLVDDIVRDMVRRVDAGDFACNDQCQGCSFRSVCRTRYHVR